MLPSMTIQPSHARPFTSNVGASYQINGKIATSKGGRKEQFKTFRVDRFTLNYSLAHDKNFLHLHFRFKTFSKRQLFLYVFIETRTITKRFFKILSKPKPQARNQTKASDLNE